MTLLGNLFGCTGVGNSNELTTQEKLEDFEYLFEILSENYPNLGVNYRMNGVNWLDEKESFKAEIEKTRDDLHFQTVIHKTVSRLNNDHTHLLTRDFFAMAYSVYTDPEYEEFDKPWADVLKDEKVLNFYGYAKANTSANRPVQSHSPAFRSQVIVPDEVAFLRINSMDHGRIEEDGEEIRNFLMEVKDYNKLIIDIRGNVGGDATYWMKNVVPPLINKRLSVDNYLFIRGNYSQPFYEAKHMKLRPIGELDDYMREKIPDEIKTDFDFYATHNVTIEPLDPVGFQGKIYLLVDKNVYSAAEHFASFSKDTGFAKLIGENTGGDGIGVDPLLFSLPNSGMVIRYTGLLALNGDGTIHAETGIIPHVQLDARVGTFEKDIAIQYVVNEE